MNQFEPIAAGDSYVCRLALAVSVWLGAALTQVKKDLSSLNMFNDICNKYNVTKLYTVSLGMHSNGQIFTKLSYREDWFDP